MAAAYYLATHGRLVVIGKEPDGDAVRFIADHPDPYAQLKHAHRIHPSADGSVRLRLEGVDAPELHYGCAAGPRGQRPAARLDRLHRAGVRPTRRHQDCRRRRPGGPGVMFTQAAELHGRPVAYLVTTVGEEEHLPPDGDCALVDRAVLDHTFNTLLVQDGVAYPTVYASTPVAHRGYLRDLAAETRKTGAGVWADDTSAEFALEDQASIGPKGS
jgi:endonuclease YncB( thermonuclease family)